MKTAASLVTLLLSLPALAQQPELRWGTDPTGGAPFIMQDAAGHYTGFEFELAQYLAAKIGRKSVLVDGTWANLPQQLAKSRDVEKGVAPPRRSTWRRTTRPPTCGRTKTWPT